MVGNKDHEEINPSGIRISGFGILDDDCMNQEINDNAGSDQKFYIEDSHIENEWKSISSIPNPKPTGIPTWNELEESIVIAPGEVKKSLWIQQDDYCEEMAHRHLFPTGKFGYKIKREFH